MAIHGQKHIGPQIAHDKASALGNKYGTDGLPMKGRAIEPIFDNYRKKVEGVMPGCERSARADHPNTPAPLPPCRRHCVVVR